MARLTLTLLGGFHARLDTGDALTISVKKAQALLGYLALPLGPAHPRDKLAALLWGDLGDAQARAGLRQTLFTLRKLLGDPHPVRLLGDSVALDPALVTVDVDAFEKSLAIGTRESLAEAAALYHGDLLEGLVLQEAPFEDWLVGERMRLREHAVETLATLLARQQDAGALNDAVRTALRLVSLDPLQEPVHRAIMRLYMHLGRRGAALRQYQVCVAALQRELAAEPDEETRALYQQILQRRPARASAPRSHAPRRDVAPATEGLLHADAVRGETPLVGRRRELARLRDALDAALAGRGQLIGVVGEAGIGKSRLVAELAAEASRKTARILLGRCYETEQVLPFGPWIAVLRASGLASDREMLDCLGPVWRTELARLLPEIAPGATPAPATSDPAQLFEAVARFLDRESRARSAIVIFEDLHWADEMSLRLLAFASRRLKQSPLLIVATVRDEPFHEIALLRRTLDELSRDDHLTRLALEPLSRHSTVALARTLVHLPPASPLEEQIWTASHGNPFIVVETLRALRGGARRDAGSPLPLTDGVRDLIARRLERLGDRSRRLVAVAAVIGRPFDFALLERAADLGEAEAAEGIEELVRHRVLHGSGERLEFTHDRIREVVYDQLVPARRTLLHRRVAEALEALCPAAAEGHALTLGRHYRAGEAWALAAVHLGRAGVLASLRYAKRDAVACYEQALAALAHLPESRQTREQAAELRFNLAHSLFSTGQLDRAKESFVLAESLAVDGGDHRRLAQIHGGMTYLQGSEGDFEAARRSGLRALTIASSLGDLGLEVWTSVGLARVYFAEGNHRAAIERLRWATDALKDTRIDERFGRGSLMPSVACRAWLALCLGQTGEFAEAIAWGGDGVRIADAAAGPLEQVWARYCLACVHLERGDASLAMPLLERAVPLCIDGRFPIYAPRVLASLGAARTINGDLDEAVSLLEHAAAQADAIKLAYGQAATLVHTGEAHLAAGRRARARRFAARALDLARHQGARGDEARAIHLCGEIASGGAPSEIDEALHHYAAALARADELGMTPLHARCHLAIGAVHHRSRHDQQARAELAYGDAMLRAMRMGHWLSKREPLTASTAER